MENHSDKGVLRALIEADRFLKDRNSWTKGVYFRAKNGESVRFTNALIDSVKYGNKDLCACSVGAVVHGVVLAREGTTPMPLDGIIHAAETDKVSAYLMRAADELFPGRATRFNRDFALDVVISFNDSENTTFKDIKAVFARAIELARADVE